MATTAAVSDTTFDTEVMKAGTPVLVDFWATWCGPCKAIAPLVEQIATENTGKLKVVKMDVDQNPVTPSKFGIMGIPTLILFKDGQEVSRIVGMQNKTSLSRELSKHL